MADSNWLVTQRLAQTPRMRLFCFPHAGGAASTFRPWGDLLLPGCELVAVQPPGRERRFAEPPFDRMDPLADAALAALRPRLDVPFAFFGHSTGALVAYEITRRLRAEGADLPVHLFASGRWAPHLRDPEPPVHALPRDELVEALRRYGGTPPEVLDHQELLELILPLLRADFAVGDTYQYRPQAPLPVPITAMGGVDDPRVSREALGAWGEHTSAAFDLHLFPGDHFYLHEQRAALLKLVDSHLRPVLLAD